MPDFFLLTVKEVDRISPSAVSVLFDVPADLKEDFKFIPGQYIDINKELNGEELRRAYSICSSLESDALRIGIKEMDEGKFSVYANRKLQAGDRLNVSRPKGNFLLQPEKTKKKNYLAIATGSGITPILSMAQSVMESEPCSKFVLLYGNRNAEDTMFKTELDSLQKSFSDRFLLHYTFSRQSVENCYSGRIDEALIDLVLSVYRPMFHIDEIFLCGQEGMIDMAKAYFKKQGFKSEQIHFELFFTEEPKKEMENFSGEAEVTVVLDDESTIFNMDRKDTVLAAALRKGLDAPYSCQGGICSSCLAKLTAGKVKMDNNRILSQEELDEGLILTCQSHPLSDKITINYDIV